MNQGFSTKSAAPGRLAGPWSFPESTMDQKALIGLLSGVTIIVVTLIGVALLNTREAEGADVTPPASPHDCSLGSKPAESGYGNLPPNVTCARAY